LTALLVGGLVRGLRSAAGLSQRALAEAAGTTQPAIARMEGGGIVPGLVALERLATATGRRLVVGFLDDSEAGSPMLAVVSPSEPGAAPLQMALTPLAELVGQEGSGGKVAKALARSKAKITEGPGTGQSAPYTGSELVVSEAIGRGFQAKVIAVSGPVAARGKTHLVSDLKVGDTVLYSKYGGTEITIDGKDLLVLNSRDVLAIVEK